MESFWNAEYKVVFAAVFVYFITLKASVKKLSYISLLRVFHYPQQKQLLLLQSSECLQLRVTNGFSVCVCVCVLQE